MDKGENIQAVEGIRLEGPDSPAEQARTDEEQEIGHSNQEYSQR